MFEWWIYWGCSPREFAMYYCTCCIVPKDILDRLSHDKTLTQEQRKAMADSARVSDALRNVRVQASLLTSVSHSIGANLVTLAAAPKVNVYDCKQTETLPGTPVPNPKASTDATCWAPPRSPCGRSAATRSR